MNKEQVKQAILNWNATIDSFMRNELLQELGKKESELVLTDWFKAQEIINKQHFYERGMKILHDLKAEGFDVKMSMQDHKLCCKDIGLYW